MTIQWSHLYRQWIEADDEPPYIWDAKHLRWVPTEEVGATPTWDERYRRWTFAPAGGGGPLIGQAVHLWKASDLLDGTLPDTGTVGGLNMTATAESPSTIGLVDGKIEVRTTWSGFPVILSSSGPTSETVLGTDPFTIVIVLRAIPAGPGDDNPGQFYANLFDGSNNQNTYSGFQVVLEVSSEENRARATARIWWNDWDSYAEVHTTSTPDASDNILWIAVQRLDDGDIRVSSSFGDTNDLAGVTSLDNVPYGPDDRYPVSLFGLANGDQGADFYGTAWLPAALTSEQIVEVAVALGYAEGGSGVV